MPFDGDVDALASLQTGGEVDVFRLRRCAILGALLMIGGAALIGFLALFLPFAYGVAKRNAHSKAAFEPLTHLRPLVFESGFGSYYITFDSQSSLSDENIRDLLSLNRLSDEYHLTVWINTRAVTDSSVAVLAQLNTTDALVLADSGLTEEGIERLAEMNPKLTIGAGDGKIIASK